MSRILTILLTTLLAAVLAACGGPSGPGADAQHFADAVVAKDYPTAAQYWLPEAGSDPQQIAALLTKLRADMTGRHGALQGAAVQDLDPAQGMVTIVWKLERAALATRWVAQPTEAGLRVAWSPFLSAGETGQLDGGGAFATMTPLPLSPAEISRTATTVAVRTEVAALMTRMTATADAYAAERATIEAEWTATAIAQQPTIVAEQTTATAAAMHATATQLARPPEAFLTARQALLRAGVRAKAREWSADALLVQANFKPVDTDGSLNATTEQESAIDGTSRVWSFMFASPKLQKLISYRVEDGVIMGDSGNDAAGYKRMFAGKGEPFDIVLEQYLDSDQAATIARENGVNVDNVDGYQLYLLLNPQDVLLERPPAQWVVRVYHFFGHKRIYLDGVTGEILKNDFGPTGSPGAIPTPLAGAPASAEPATPAPHTLRALQPATAQRRSRAHLRL